MSITTNTPTPSTPASELNPILAEHLAKAREWLCECEQRCDPWSADWRWNGIAWEHYHGYPIGHVPATHVIDEEAEGA